MKYPRDITQLVNDLAETPGVQKVFLIRFESGQLSIVSVWPSRFKADSVIMLHENHFLKIEGEWPIALLSIGDATGFLNESRKSAGLAPLAAMAEIGDGSCIRSGFWSGDMLIGFTD